MGHVPRLLQRDWDLNTFKNKIKKWKADNCPGRLCKVYINNIGFTWEQKGNLLLFSSIRRSISLLVSIILSQGCASILNFLTFNF